jgi:hypothetical protein
MTQPIEYVISHTFETQSPKSSHFLSVKYRVNEAEPLQSQVLRSKAEVGRLCILGALAQGALSKEDAQKKIQLLQGNVDKLGGIPSQVKEATTVEILQSQPAENDRHENHDQSNDGIDVDELLRGVL